MERLTERNEYGVYYPYCDSAKGYGGHCASCEFERKITKKLAEYEDAEEDGLLIRLDSKDKLIEVLATKLLHSEFGHCYMCKNPMKNITLDGINNGCDGGCNTDEEFTVDDFLKKIVAEMNRKAEAEQTLAKMKGV